MSEGRKIAILGSASTSINMAPFACNEWEIWALGNEGRRVTRYFEMHEDMLVKSYIRDNYRNAGVPVFALHELTGVKTTPYPLQDIFKMLGSEYLTSSIAYMLALALFEHDHGQPVSEIALYGVDMLTDSEYAMQRPCAEYLLGMAKGKGILITIPTVSVLLKANYIYGLKEKPKNTGPFSIAGLIERRAEYNRRKTELEQNALLVSGAIQELQALIDYAKHWERGGYLSCSESR